MQMNSCHSKLSYIGGTVVHILHMNTAWNIGCQCGSDINKDTTIMPSFSTSDTFAKVPWMMAQNNPGHMTGYLC